MQNPFPKRVGLESQRLDLVQDHSETDRQRERETEGKRDGDRERESESLLASGAFLSFLLPHCSIFPNHMNNVNSFPGLLALGSWLCPSLWLSA